MVLPLATATSPSLWAILFIAEGAIHNGNDILCPKTFADVSTEVTSLKQ